VIEYDRTSWWRTCLAVRGTVLPHVLGRVGLLTTYALMLCLVNEFVLRKYNDQLPALDPLGHTVMGTALGMLIVFRTNSSYNRFWEARSHWGAIVNASRNLARAAAVYAPPAGELARLIAAYVLALKEHLRGSRDLSELRSHVPGRLLEEVAAAGNPPAILARTQSRWIATRLAEGRIDTIQASRMEGLVAALTDAQGGCEKILKTPLPFTYAALIKQVLLLYLVSLPLVLIDKFWFAAPLVVAGVSLGLLGIEEAGVEIEDPFGTGPNHLPLDRICETIVRDTAALASDPDGKLS
jgi:ion channel-forming bestrophin family protein